MALTSGPKPRYKDPNGIAARALVLWISDDEADVGSSPSVTPGTADVTFDNPIATGHWYFDLGTDTSATGFAVRNNSGTELLAVTGDGAVSIAGGVSFALGDDDPLNFGGVPDVSATWISASDDWLFDQITATSSTIFRLGTDTAATDFQVQNDSSTALLTITGAGALTYSAAAAISIGDATGALTFDGAGDTILTDGTAALEMSGAGVVTLTDGVGTLTLDGAGNITEAAFLDCTLAFDGTTSITSATALSIGDATGTWEFDGAGAVSTTGVTTLDLDGSGAVSLESSGGAINVGADAVAQAVNIGTGAAARAITIGNAASASVAIDAGVGTLDLSGDANVRCNDRLVTTDGVASGTERVVGGLAYAQVAASAAVSNTTSETDFDQTYPIPANTLKAGSTIRIKAAGITTASTGNTLIIKGYIGTIAFMTSATVAQAANDEWYAEVDLTVRTAGTGGTIVGAAKWYGPDAPGTVQGQANLASTAIDTTAEQVVKFSATWGGAATGDSVRQDMLNVDVA